LHAGEKFPDWVPEGAIEIAKEGIEEEFIPLLLTLVKEYKEAGMSSEDFQGCELRHPYEIVKIDVERYTKGMNMKEIFERCGDDKIRIGFSVYCDGKRLGIIEAYLDSLDKWHYESTGFASYERFIEGRDVLGELFKAYKFQDGFKIYRVMLGNEYLIVKDGRVVKIAIYNISDNAWEYHEPDEIMVKSKERYMKFKHFIEERRKKAMEGKTGGGR